ncbi:MAG: hypothetical protein HY815_15015 [Candidatus Riflebacteria bacterium]|nr:hypothetical protein [Candidatus Riflebacteria bacterium]
MRAEYEANLLQLTMWPAEYPTDMPFSLDQWCILRGYDQALDVLVNHVLTEPRPYRMVLDPRFPRRYGALVVGSRSVSGILSMASRSSGPKK